MTINQKNQIPRFPGATNKQLSRGEFLSGANITYYGSGQGPDAMPVSGSYAHAYRAPVDWNHANTLLRVPQQVWLAIDAVDVGTQPYTKSGYGSAVEIYGVNLDSDTRDYNKVEMWTDGHLEYIEPNVGSPNYYDLPYIYPMDSHYVTQLDENSYSVHDYKPVSYSYTTVANWSDLENSRLGLIFLSVQSAIQSLRPGRTWVDVIDYNNYTIWPNNVVPTGAFPNIGARYEHVIAPDSSVPFFGTRFLHIYCGYPVDPQQQNLTDGTYLTSKAFVAGSYPLFSKYGTYLYAIGANNQQGAIAQPPQIPVPGPPDGTVIVDFSESFIGANASQVAAINAFNAQIQAYGPSTAAYFTSVAADLAAYGYAYKGDSSLITDANYLVALIAAYFNFDPDTGEDL